MTGGKHAASRRHTRQCRAARCLTIGPGPHRTGSSSSGAASSFERWKIKDASCVAPWVARTAASARPRRRDIRNSALVDLQPRAEHVALTLEHPAHSGTTTLVEAGQQSYSSPERQRRRKGVVDAC
jgi:hypothetical protein